MKGLFKCYLFALCALAFALGVAGAVANGGLPEILEKSEGLSVLLSIVGACGMAVIVTGFEEA